MSQPVLKLLSVPTGYGDEKDYYLLCDCGWCSLPHVQMPARLICDACKELADGRRMYEQFFVPQAGQHGYQVEWTSKGE